MARLIPPVVGVETVSPGERKLFERFRTESGSDGWVVLHSLDIPRHSVRVAGEIDFVVAVPGLGVLCLEVKAHRSVIRDSSGMWHLGQDPPTRIGPFRQCSDAMHSLRAYVTKRAPELRDVVFWSAVAFTDTPFSVTAPAEWHDWQVMDSGALAARSLPHLVRAVLENARQHLASVPNARWFDPGSNSLSDADIEQLVRVLRPSFEFYESPKARRRQHEDELRHFTEEQFDALRVMELNQRVIFEGPAGTGKTLLALEEARRGVERGDRVLLCCFNRLLGRWLRQEAEPLLDRATVGTFHSALLELSSARVPESPSWRFWEEELPGAVWEEAVEGRIEKFDVLIIDEAQDLLRTEYLDVFDQLLKGGVQHGVWRMFGDFEQQAIYGSSSLSIDDACSAWSITPTRYPMLKNCRNTPRIAAFVKLLAAYERGYPDVLRPDNGAEPSLKFWTTREDQDRQLGSLLDSLKAERYSGRDIAILSPRAEGCAAEQLSDRHWADQIRPARELAPGGIRYCTIHAFKGLEAPVVIVTDVDSVGTEEDHSLLYTALTRATDRLFVLADIALKSSVEALLLRRPESEQAQ